MKKAGVVIVAIIVIAAACFGFYFAKQKTATDPGKSVELTETEKIINKQLSKDYPETPREVVKLYNRIISCYYGGKYDDDEFEKLADQTLLLFDDALVANNPRDTYVQAVKSDIASYKKAGKSIYQTYVCDSNDVTYIKDSDDELAYVDASYFLKEGNSFSKTYEQYVLRQDADGNWKILGYYKIEGDSSKSDD